MPGVIVTYPNVESTMKIWRRKGNNAPVVPKSSQDIIEQLQDPSINEKFGSCECEKFVHIVPRSCERAGQSIMLMNESNLEKLNKENATCFADATFNFFPSFFRQLFIIHFLVGKFVSFY